jgi:hypothetical protein
MRQRRTTSTRCMVHADREKNLKKLILAYRNFGECAWKPNNPYIACLRFVLSVKLWSYHCPSIREEESQLNCCRLYLNSENKSTHQKNHFIFLSEVINQNGVNPFILALEFDFVLGRKSYTGWFRKKSPYFGRRYYRPLWENVHCNVCLVLNVCWYTSIWISRNNFVRFLFDCVDEERSLQKEGGYTRRIANSNFECCWLHKKNVNINSDEQHAIFAHELQSALRLTVGFLNIYYLNKYLDSKFHASICTYMVNLNVLP